jgi:hypothetical protein
MSECKPSEKSGIGRADVSSLSSILNVILSAFRLAQKPAQPIPPPLLLIGKNLRPGMSARNLTARKLSRVEADAGVPVGDVFADGPNKLAQQTRIEDEELVTMLQTEAKVDVALDPGIIQVTSTGFAGPIPVVAQGANTLPAFGSGGIS